MSQTTTAAATRKPSFGWVAECLEEHPPAQLDMTAISRRTFVHLDSASPLARLANPQMLQSLKDFSKQHGNRRRHTLTPVVVDVLDQPALVRPRVQPETDDPIMSPSPIARLTDRHAQTFDKVWNKDDSYAPNLKQCPTNTNHDRNALAESQDLSTRMSEAVLGGPMSVRGPNKRLAPLIESPNGGLSIPGLTAPLTSEDSPLTGTPTPMESYFDNLFLGDRPPLIPGLGDRSGGGGGHVSGSHVSGGHVSGGHVSGERAPISPLFTDEGRSPTKLRPLADLLQSPWVDQEPPRAKAAPFNLADWIATLPEADHYDASTSHLGRGSLSELISLGTTARLLNIFASPVAQPLLAVPNEATGKPKSVDENITPPPGDPRSGHPTSCKPCAFFWSKGCLNGEDCRFCHEWHAPKKKKPMKDQKNLMIIAREDGKIAFLRCAIEDALKHQ